jgi:hypothetical protein
MERRAILEGLAAAETRLAKTEALLWREREVLDGLLSDDERSEALRRTEALQQERLRCALEVQRLHDELGSPDNGE